MMDEVDFELCLDIDQYVATSCRESKRLSAQSATDSVKHDNVRTVTTPNPKVRKHGELEPTSDIDENITQEPLYYARQCKRLKVANQAKSDLEDDHDRTYLDIAIKRITTHHDREVLSDADDTDLETYSSTNTSTAAINEETMDLDTDTDAKVHANSSSYSLTTSPSHSYIARPSHIFHIYEDPDDSHLENHPGIMSSITTYSANEDKENILDDDYEQQEQTQRMGFNSQMWTRHSTNRFSHVVSSGYQGVDGGADTDEADTDVEEFLTEGGDGSMEVEMEDVRVSFHSLGAGEASLLPLAFPLPLRIPSPALVQGNRIAGRRRCLEPRPVVHFE